MVELTAKQLAEWEAYDRLDPIGRWRDDFQMAYLASTMTNLAISIHGKKGAKLTQVIDYMPKWDEEKQEYKVQTVEEMKSVLTSLVSDSKSGMWIVKDPNAPPRRIVQNKIPKL